MKPFNLAEFKRRKDKGEEPKLITRDGRDARIICIDRKGIQPIIALIYDNKEEIETTNTYDEYGCAVRVGYESQNDLFFAPTKHKGWVNVYSKDFGKLCSKIYDTEAEAKEIGNTSHNYLATAPIEWEY